MHAFTLVIQENEPRLRAAADDILFLLVPCDVLRPIILETHY